MSTLSQFFGGGGGAIPIQFVAVAGGGSGGATGGTSTASGGGGGAGCVFAGFDDVPIGSFFPITIGAGGAGPAANTLGSNGSDTVFGVNTLKGGGCGATSSLTNTGANASDPLGFDGSAGGGAANSTTLRVAASAVGPTTDGLGLTKVLHKLRGSGGAAIAPNTTNNLGGGGGGAMGNGADAVSGQATAPGGAGLQSSITGAAVTYGVGGTATSAAITSNGADGAANTGGGGGGASSLNRAGGSGGSGVVIIAYPDTYPAPTAITGTYTTPTRSGYRVYRFTGSGSITF